MDYRHLLGVDFHSSVRYNDDGVSMLLSVSEIKTVVEPIVKNTGVEKIVLFGSYAKGIASESSDIDLCMYSNRTITGFAFYDLKSKFEDAFNVDIDLFPDVNIVPNSPIEQQISESGVVIYERQR